MNRCGLTFKSNWAPLVWYRKFNQRIRFWLNQNGWFKKYFEPLRAETIKYGRMKWENITPEMHKRWMIVNWKRGCGRRYYTTEEQDKEFNETIEMILKKIKEEEK
jgi:hypothetical protein